MALRVRRRQGGSPTRRAAFNASQSQGINSQNQQVGLARARAVPPKGRLRPGSMGYTPPRPPAAPAAQYTPVGPTAPTAPRAIAPPQTASSVAMRANAEQGLMGANNNYRDSLFRAIMGLGDPSQFAKYQADPMFAGYNFAQDPNSVFASLQRQETEGLKGIDESANAGNTFFSGNRLTDRQNLTNETDYQRLGASTDFLENLRQLAGALTGAQGDYRQGIGDADQLDIDAALQAARDNRAASPGAPPKGIPTGPAKGVARTTPPVARATPAQQRQAAEAFSRAQRKKRK